MQNDCDYKDFLIDLVNNNKLSYFILLKRQYKYIYNFLIEKFGDKLNGHPISEYVYWYLNNLNDFPKCANPNCNSHNVKFKGIVRGYTMYCSRLCMQTDPLTEQKRVTTNLTLYGVQHAQQSQIIKDKVKTLRDKRIEDYSTYLVNFGNKVRDGFKQKEKENPNYWKDREQKTKATKVANGHDPNWNNREKFKKTISNFSEDKKQKILSKRIKSRLTHIDEIGLKISTTIAKNRKENPNYQLDILNKRYKTKLKKYGDPYSRNSKKAKQTCLMLYGVESYTQTSEYHNKRSKRYKSLEYQIDFDSKWEFYVYDFCIKHHIPIVYQPNISFEYSYKNKKHKYNPDFLIQNKLYEVKGDHFFNSDGTMKCPFKLKSWSDLQYKEICELYEAKHQCMLNNNVIILRHDEITKLESIFL